LRGELSYAWCRSRRSAPGRSGSGLVRPGHIHHLPHPALRRCRLLAPPARDVRRGARPVGGEEPQQDLSVRGGRLDGGEGPAQPRRRTDECDRTARAGPRTEEPARGGGLEHRAQPVDSGAASAGSPSRAQTASASSARVIGSAPSTSPTAWVTACSCVAVTPCSRSQDGGKRRRDSRSVSVATQTLRSSAGSRFSVPRMAQGADQHAVGPERRVETGTCRRADARDEDGGRRDLGVHAAQPLRGRDRIGRRLEHQLPVQPPARHLLPRDLHVAHLSTALRHELAGGKGRLAGLKGATRGRERGDSRA
jgi:hypothetical protein